MKRYNESVVRVQKLVKTGTAPRNALPPKVLDLKDFWDLDKDRSAFVDPALVHDGGDEEPPLWLADDNMKTAILGLLLSRRCVEETERLDHQCNVLEAWAIAKHQALCRAAAVLSSKHQCRHTLIMF